MTNLDFEDYTKGILDIPLVYDRNFIYQLVNDFDMPIQNLNYQNNNLDSLSIALSFYKSYNMNYYNLIRKGIENKNIIISGNGKSITYKDINKTNIKLMGNDSDIIMIVHELAHYVDFNNNIVPDKY